MPHSVQDAIRSGMRESRFFDDLENTSSFPRETADEISKNQDWFLKLKAERYDQDTKLKKEFFRIITRLIWAWSAAIWLTLYFVGKYRNGFYLSDTVVCTLLKATFFAIIGLPVVAAHHFFPKRK